MSELQDVIFKSLSDPTRRALFEREQLFERGMVAWIAAETEHGFGGVGDDTADAEAIGSCLENVQAEVIQQESCREEPPRAPS